MDSAQIAVSIGGVVLVCLVLWFFFGVHEEKTGAKNAASGPIYACPMHPWIQSDDPAANCSVCGMKLVLQSEVKAAEKASHPE